jgi:hypothetical protein
MLGELRSTLSDFVDAQWVLWKRDRTVFGCQSWRVQSGWKGGELIVVSRWLTVGRRGPGPEAGFPIEGRKATW